MFVDIPTGTTVQNDKITYLGRWFSLMYRVLDWTLGELGSVPSSVTGLVGDLEQVTLAHIVK